MRSDGAALLLLAWTLAVAFVAIALLVRGASARAALAERGRGGGEDARMSRLRQRLDARLRRTQTGRRLGNWLQGAGSPLSAGDLVLLCVFGTLIATVIASSFMPSGIARHLALQGERVPAVFADGPTHTPERTATP